MVASPVWEKRADQSSHGVMRKADKLMRYIGVQKDVTEHVAAQLALAVLQQQ